MERTRCTPIAICSSPMELDGCTIQYGTNPFYNMLSQPIQAHLNSPKVLPAMKRNTTYYHHVTVIDNSTTVALRSVHKTENCEESSDVNHYYVACGLVSIFSYNVEELSLLHA